MVCLSRKRTIILDLGPLPWPAQLSLVLKETFDRPVVANNVGRILASSVLQSPYSKIAATDPSKWLPLQPMSSCRVKILAGSDRLEPDIRHGSWGEEAAETIDVWLPGLVEMAERKDVASCLKNKQWQLAVVATRVAMACGLHCVVRHGR